MTNAPTLASPLRLPCDVELPNRIGKSAMTEGLADASGHAGPRLDRLYGAWSEGGAGLLITGNVMVDWRFLERPGNVVVEDREGLEALSAWARAGTRSGNQLWAQISHPGRQCSRMSSRHPVAPSPVTLRLAGLFARPRQLADGEISALVGRYAETAAILREAGFTGVQIHAAHGYLISQFLSPRVNERSDRWGGSLENRARFLREVVRAVRSRVGSEFPVAVKLNSADFQRGGLEEEDSATVARWLAEDGVDLLEISGGTYEKLRFFGDGAESGEASGGGASVEKAEASRQREAYFLDFARRLRAEVGDLPLMVTGGFRSRVAMTAALENGEVDVVGVARPLCVEPDLPRRLLAGEVDQAPRWEDTLRLGPGWLGPSSRLRNVRAFNHQAQVAWFYRQILAQADGRPPDTTLSARGALLRHLRDELRLARLRRRDRRWRRGEG